MKKFKLRAIKRIRMLLLVLITLWGPAFGQKRSSIALEHGAHRIGRRTDRAMQQWRDYGLGQFIHWGVYAIPGGYWNGKYYPGAAEWIRSWKEMPKEAYDNLYKQFDPASFDAGKWARQAKAMGVKYLIFTTKHHDGFCMWPSKYTDYTVASSPYKKDIVKEIVDAYTKEGIDVYLYFSIIDWHHPGYQSAPPATHADSVRYETFKTFTRNQLIELLTNYPQVKGLWFDGTWDKAWVNEAAWTDELGKELRAMHSGLIIGSRFRADEYGKRHYDSNGDLIGDYDQTWERDLPEKIEDTNGFDWDCAMTIPENQWGYCSRWQGYVKTSFDLIEMLAKTVSMDGNLVINFGPDGQGNIRPEESRLAEEIGQWMKVNGEAIYGCSHAGLKPQGWGYFTQKGDQINLIVFNMPISRRLTLEIPRDGAEPLKAWLLNGKSELQIHDAGKNKKGNSLYQIELPAFFLPDQPFTVVMKVGKPLAVKREYQQAKI